MFEQAIQKYLKEKGYDKINLKAVLFDMDGVLFDSMKNHAKAWNKAMSMYGMNLSEEEAYMHEGRTGASTINIVSTRERGYSADEEEIKRLVFASFSNKRITISNQPCYKCHSSQYFDDIYIFFKEIF